MSQRLSGKEASQALQQALLQDIALLSQKPRLAILIPCRSDASTSYLTSRQRIAATLGIEIVLFSYDTIEEGDLIRLIQQLNQDASIGGIMVDRPLPKGVQEARVFDAIDPKKDVDGCSVFQAGLLMQGKPSLAPSTAQAVVALLEYYHIDVKGKHVVVVGRSNIVGMPSAKLLLDKHATVTICHSRTTNLAHHTLQADILIVAIGKKQFITKEYVQPNTIVVDVGIHYDETQGWCGDVHQEVYPRVKAYSPVPGGVGPLTSFMLMKNLIHAIKMREV